jgi:protein TonB
MLPKDKAEQSADSPQCAPQERFGSLNGCMVEGDAEQRFRERRIRRWSLAVSIAVQSVLLVVLVIAPLFGKTEKISYTFTPIPPYGHPPKSPHTVVEGHSHHLRAACAFCPPTAIPTRIETQTSRDLDPFPSDPTASEIRGVMPFEDSRSQPPRPPDIVHENNLPKRLIVDHIQPAMLTRRIEPVYPILAIQTHRAGRVELHAIIATDGSMKSLQVVEGDPLFVQSALDAVRQWHYQPTMLNGQPVEVDTRITVIYTMP